MSGTDASESSYGLAKGAEVTAEERHITDSNPIQAQVDAGSRVLIPAFYVDGGDLLINVRIHDVTSEPVSYPRDRVLFADPARARLALALADARHAWRQDQAGSEPTHRLEDATAALDAYDDGTASAGPPQ